MEISRGYYKSKDDSLVFIVGEIPENIGVVGQFMGYIRPLGLDGYDSDWLPLNPLRWHKTGKNTWAECYDIIAYMGQEECAIKTKPRKKRGMKG